MNYVELFKIGLFIALYLAVFNYLRNVYHSQEQGFFSFIIDVLLMDALIQAVFRLFWLDQ